MKKLVSVMIIIASLMGYNQIGLLGAFLPSIICVFSAICWIVSNKIDGLPLFYNMF